MELTVIIVNFNTCRLLRDCLDSVFKNTTGLEYQVIVVDNASTDGSVEMMRNEFPDVRVVENERNVGFAAANNQAWRTARSDYVLLLNSDTIVREGVLRDVVGFMRSNDEAGIVGCKLINPDGSLQRSTRSFPGVWNLFVEATFLYHLFPRSELFGKYYMTCFDHESIRRVDIVMGAFMMIRQRVWNKIGLLDESYFMYTEEADYCHRARETGEDTYFYPGASVVHLGGGSVRSMRLFTLQLHRSQIHFLRTRFRGLKRFACVSIKYCGIVLRIILYGSVGLISPQSNWREKAIGNLDVLRKP